MRKRALSLVLALSFALLPAFARAADVPSSWAQEDVEAAIAENLVPVALQSQYTQAITRAEFAFLAVTLHEMVMGKAIELERNPFTDTNDLNAVKAAVIGVTTGTTATTFRPDDTLTREQAATMLARLAGAVGKPLAQYGVAAVSFSDAAQISPWAGDAVEQMQASGIMGGTGNNAFSPQGTYTREESILTVLRLYRAVGGAASGQVRPERVELNLTSVSLETGKYTTLSATVHPDGVQDKTVTWSSSNEAVALVAWDGVVTAVSKGTANIIATAANGVAATCVVTVTDPVKFTVPKLNYEYGPFKVTSYYSTGRYWDSTQIDSLVVTKCEETRIEKYLLSISIQGMTDGERVNVYIYFYDANNRMLGKAWLNERVSPNTPFNILDEFYVEYDIINNATRLEFYSYSGEAAVAGTFGVGPSPTVTPPDEPPVTPPKTEEPSSDDYAVLPGAPDFEKFVQAGRLSLTTNTKPGQSNNADITVSGSYSLPDGDYLPHIQPYLDELIGRGYTSSAAPPSTMTYKKDVTGGTIYISITPSKSPGDNYVVVFVATFYGD